MALSDNLAKELLLGAFCLGAGFAIGRWGPGAPGGKPLIGDPRINDTLDGGVVVINRPQGQSVGLTKIYGELKGGGGPPAVEVTFDLRDRDLVGTPNASLSVGDGWSESGWPVVLPPSSTATVGTITYSGSTPHHTRTFELNGKTHTFDGGYDSDIPNACQIDSEQTGEGKWDIIIRHLGYYDTVPIAKVP